MSPSGPYARTIIEAELVAKRIDEAAKKTENLADLYEYGIKWKIARRPDSGNKVSDSDYYLAKSYSWAPGGVPSVTVLYRFDDNHVYIESSKIDWPKK
ncbi:MAG: hypothetical protein L0Y67_03940 [Gammaproteobacteria bacterium]|nr:hypothetical protein [Gammaproteobacteria bacterium]MCI0590746.1 hypothetical protein [Gammaproteobacteria bacterium]